MKRYLQYVRDVKKGKILSCEKLKKAVARFERDLAESKTGAGQWIFDQARADQIIDFMECLVQFEEPFAGQPLTLAPWQCFFLAQLYGWRHRETGRRRFRKALLFMGRKQGKTIKASGLTLYEMLTKDGIEAYSLATKQEIANKTLRNLKAFIAQDEELQEILRVYSYSIINRENFSSFKPLSRDSDLDGLNPAYVIVDELAAQRDGSAYSILTSGMGTRSEALTVIISTAGYGTNNPLLEEYEYASKILDGSISDDTYLAALYEYDRTDKWDDLDMLQKSCPNLGVTVPRSYFEDQLKQARSIPKLAAEYKTKYCNLWQSSNDTWIPDKTWMKGASVAKYEITEEELRGAPCVVALDFSTIWDYTAVTRYFHLARLGKYRALHRFYIPEDQIDSKIHLENPSIRAWIERGLIVATPGECIDYSYVFRDFDADLLAYDVRAAVYDPAKAKEFVMNYETKTTIMPFRQNAANMSPAAKAWEKAIVDGQILDDNPVMRWMVSNAINKAHPDSGAYFITKSQTAKSRKRIDGVITSLMAYSVLRDMVFQMNQPKPKMFDLAQIKY